MKVSDYIPKGAKQQAKEDRAGMIAFLILFGIIMLLVMVFSETPHTSLPNDCTNIPEKFGGC